MDTGEVFAHARTIHMIGIKGTGMASLAEILVSQGLRVTGSDTDEVFHTDRILERIGVCPNIGFRAENIPSDTDVIVYSTSYVPETNAELFAALEGGKPVLKYAEALGQFSRGHMSIAVAGSHGKTTTTAMLGEVLRAIGKDPLALVGGVVKEWGGSALLGKGDTFVFEADEYQNKLAYYHPFGVILTNVDWDHPDFFPDEASYESVFREFVKRIPKYGFLVYCNDDARAVDIANEAICSKVSYGMSKDSDLRIITREYEGVRQRFLLERDGSPFGTFELLLSGKHNVLNATAVIAASELLKGDQKIVRNTLVSFQGALRRFEYIGTMPSGTLVYDDFAHHPSEIRATLAAFRERFPEKRITVVFHPHTYSRTEALFSEFSQCFEIADHVILLDIYGSAREQKGTVTSAKLAEAINRYFPHRAEDGMTIEEAGEMLANTLTGDDLLITMGAGDVWKLGNRIFGRQ